MKINYENVYNLKDFEQAIFKAEREVNKAKDQVKQEQQNYKTQVSKQLGISIEDLQFSNECCSAKGICYHVYHLVNKFAVNGSPENKCIYCNADNYDPGLY